MPEIDSNYQIISRYPSHSKMPVQSRVRQITLPEYYRREKRKNSGLIEKLYNSIKNITGLGMGSRKVEGSIAKANSGEISTEQAKKDIKKYSASQENSAQLFGDSVSVLASLFTFFGMNKAFKYLNAGVRGNYSFFGAIDKKATDYQMKLICDKNFGPKNVKLFGKPANLRNAANKGIDLYKDVINTIRSNKRMTAIAVAFAAVVGGLSKYFVLKINRLGSDEYKVDSEIYGNKKYRTDKQKKAAKVERHNLNVARHDQNFRNFYSGAINGLMTPVIALGGLVGAPIYLAVNSLNRYFVGTKTDKNKSMESYFSNLGNDFATTALVTGALAVPIVKKGNWTKVFNENIRKVARRLSVTEQKASEYAQKSSYKKMEEIILQSPSIRNITEDRSISVDEQMKKLINENIFAAKFKQACGDRSELAIALGQDCPATRTLEQAQKYVNTKMGNSNYKLSKLLGVGTVAETYLAKDASGRDVVVKILKDGISEQKIIKDKEKFVKIIKNNKKLSQHEKEYMLRNVDNLAEGILKEVDLKNELIAAEKIAKSTHMANVVRPIEVKNNIYVMEKATGVSLRSFIELNDLYIQREAAEKIVNDNKRSKKIIEEIDKKIEKVKEKMPDFDDIKLDKNDSQYLLEEYRKVFVEQFHKIDNNGKVIHGDIHPGNIFIDPNVLKTRKGKLYTLIDTGNSIDMSVDQSMRALNLSKYIQNGNVKDIVDYVLEGATLPQGLTREEAAKKIEAELRKCFFDETVQLSHMNDSVIFDLTDGIMQKFDIVPSSTQTSLKRCRNSAMESYANLVSSIANFGFVDAFSKDKSGSQKALSGTMAVLENVGNEKIFEEMIKKQEKDNLSQLPKHYRQMQKSDKAPAKNSEDYITYKLKQWLFNHIKFGD